MISPWTTQQFLLTVPLSGASVPLTSKMISQWNYSLHLGNNCFIFDCRKQMKLCWKISSMPSVNTVRAVNEPGASWPVVVVWRGDNRTFLSFVFACRPVSSGMDHMSWIRLEICWTNACSLWCNFWTRGFGFGPGSDLQYEKNVK